MYAITFTIYTSRHYGDKKGLPKNAETEAENKKKTEILPKRTHLLSLHLKKKISMAKARKLDQNAEKTENFELMRNNFFYATKLLRASFFIVFANDFS